MTTIITKNGSGAPTAGQLSEGELAVDLTNKELYTKSGSTVIKIGGTGGGETGTFTDLTATSSFTSPGIDDNATSTAITIDGSQKVGIGVTDPETALDVAGSITSSSSYRLRDSSTNDRTILIMSGDDPVFQTGTASGTRSLLFKTEGTERMRIDASGNLGIGTDAPQSGNETTNLTIEGAQVARVGLRSAAPTGGDYSFYAAAAGSLGLYDNAASDTRFLVDASGNVLVGDTTSYLSAANRKVLHVTGGSDGSILGLKGTTGDFYIHSGGSGSTDVNIVNRAAGNMTFLTDNSEAMRIDASGNVGIGTSDPSLISSGYKGLHINSDVAGASLKLTNPNTGAGSGDGFDINIDSSAIVTFINREPTGIQRWYTGGSERMRIDASGNLLVGTSSSSTSSGVGNKILTGTTSPSYSVVGTDTDNTSVGYRLYSTGAGAFRFYVTYAGNIYATSTSITAISDASLKENVRDLDKGLDTINALQPRRFDWKNGDGNDIMGFIAQEVEEVMPELVHEYKYSDEENKKGLKMGDMIPSLVKAIQEQQAMIETLQAEVAALKGA